MKKITLAVLAGGAGSRMGVAKGTLRVRGKTILEFLLDRWNWPGPTMLVTAPGRERPAGWERFSREVSDLVGGEGPLRGISTALRAAETPTVVVATCDMPLVTPAQFEWLIETLDARAGSLGVICKRLGVAIEPFPSIFRVGAISEIERRLAMNRRSVHSLAEDERFALVQAPEWPAEVWTNLNNPADLNQFESS